MSLPDSSWTPPASPELPPQRAAVLEFLRRELAAGRAPSLAEVALAFGFASRTAAQKHVQALVADGLIEQVPGQKRGRRLPGGSADLLPLPVLGRVAAGLPLSAEGVASLGLRADAGGEELWLDRRLFSPRPDYLLRVQGDSMIDDGILDGDLVGVHRPPEARDGQTVVARVDGELTIKRRQRARRRIRLLPRNPAHAPIEVEPGQDFAIEGVYCGLVRRG
ncbi:transcriptional repressor LexA [Pseudoxanthomonas koreensis]|uniref:transcriptional repressor LexA n=1 Tax=Pseudoxanthomonas koreensis TaxID=266061 RepID=UPI0013912FFF|nr:transcriptional repressor LexA [Pseudoxanthomonas koreensis]KAF1690078.1 repressor LexA [Pseudoxanthomonas koreensis]